MDQSDREKILEQTPYDDWREFIAHKRKHESDNGVQQAY